MPCCATPRSTISNQQHSATNLMSVGMNNVYELQAYPGDFNPYNGMFRADSIYVVGFESEHERLFRRKDSKQAIAYAKTTVPGTILHLAIVPVTQICERAIEDLYSLS